MASPSAKDARLQADLEATAQRISMLDGSDDERNSAFNEIKKGMLNAKKSAPGVIEAVEPKDAVLKFLIDLYNDKKKYQKQIKPLLQVFVELEPWKQVLFADGGEIHRSMSEELIKDLGLPDVGAVAAAAPPPSGAGQEEAAKAEEEEHAAREAAEAAEKAAEAAETAEAERLARETSEAAEKAERDRLAAAEMAERAEAELKVTLGEQTKEGSEAADALFDSEDGTAQGPPLNTEEDDALKVAEPQLEKEQPSQGGIEASEAADEKAQPPGTAEAPPKVESLPTQESVQSLPAQDAVQSPSAEEAPPAPPTQDTVQASLTPEAVQSLPTQEAVQAPPTEEAVQSLPTQDTVQAPPLPEAVQALPTQEAVQAPAPPEVVQAAPTQETVQALPTQESVLAAPTQETVQAPPTEGKVEAPQTTSSVAPAHGKKEECIPNIAMVSKDALGGTSGKSNADLFKQFDNMTKKHKPAKRRSAMLPTEDAPAEPVPTPPPAPRDVPVTSSEKVPPPQQWNGPPPPPPDPAAPATPRLDKGAHHPELKQAESAAQSEWVYQEDEQTGEVRPEEACCMIL